MVTNKMSLCLCIAAESRYFKCLTGIINIYGVSLYNTCMLLSFFFYNHSRCMYMCKLLGNRNEGSVQHNFTEPCMFGNKYEL